MTRLRIQCLKESKSSSFVSEKRVIELCRKLVKEFRDHHIIKESISGPREPIELTLVFLGFTKAKALNKKFRGKDYATDVLSFSPEAPHEGLGDLVICADIIKKQAK